MEEIVTPLELVSRAQKYLASDNHQKAKQNAIKAIKSGELSAQSKSDAFFLSCDNFSSRRKTQQGH